MNTKGGYTIDNFQLDPDFNTTKDYPFKYKGFIKDVPDIDGTGKTDYPCRWSEKGECRNDIRPDCFIDVDKAEVFFRVYTEEEVRQAVEFGLWSFDEFDKNSNYDSESRKEGLKEIQDDFVSALNKNK